MCNELLSVNIMFKENTQDNIAALVILHLLSLPAVKINIYISHIPA